ncbi:MAG: NUDIX hydrolase, partial [Candidatus Omnitrophica bacterium]|nr:NUDIX hydrolase [Candidatus Omnitrophota bacterium]
PAGTLKRGESPLACARRELAEEIGYKARSIALIGRIFTTPGFSDEIIYVYRAIGLSCVSLRPDADEIIEKAIFTKSQLRAMLKDGRIADSKTISGLSLCGVF